MMIDRRDLVVGVGTFATAGLIGKADAQSASAPQAAPPSPPKPPPPAPPAPPKPFDQNSILGLERELAKSPYRPPPAEVPDFLSSLTYYQYVAIRAKPSAVIWSDDNVGFAIEPLHRGFVFSSAMQIFVVE